MAPAADPPAHTTIVVADDDGDIRRLIRFTLERRGYTIVEAADGAVAVNETRRTQPRLVILDVMMPRVNGIEACRQLQADPATRDIPVLFLSAKGQKPEIEQGIGAGAMGYLVKPFSPKELAAYIEGLLKGGASPPPATP